MSVARKDKSVDNCTSQLLSIDPSPYSSSEFQALKSSWRWCVWQGATTYTETCHRFPAVLQRRLRSWPNLVCQVSYVWILVLHKNSFIGIFRFHYSNSVFENWWRPITGVILKDTSVHTNPKHITAWSLQTLDMYSVCSWPHYAPCYRLKHDIHHWLLKLGRVSLPWEQQDTIL